jgi:hypothetical protein
MGGRMFRNWLCMPLRYRCDRGAQDAVEELMGAAHANRVSPAVANIAETDGSRHAIARSAPAA